MSRRISNYVMVLAVLFGLIGAFARARETIGERAQRLRNRSQRVRPRSTDIPHDKVEYRFNNSNSAGYFVKSLPDINFDLGELYSGQIPVDSKDPSRKMFFVFQPTTGEPVDEIVIWFNGGPGCSSLEGFLQETGRFIWSWSMYAPLENPYAWTKLSNILWVEYPVGLGFSTGSVHATSQEETARDFVGFFKNFQEVFGISNFKIYITGESYAGRYVPFVASAMLDQKDTKHFNLSGALAYDPCIGRYDYVGQTVPAVSFVQKMPQIFNLNDTLMRSLEEAHQSCGYSGYIDRFMKFPPAEAQPAFDTPFNSSDPSCNTWENIYNAAYQTNPCFNVYEVNIMCPMPSDPLSFASDVQYAYPGIGGTYFNRSDVKEAIHAPQDVSWAECSGPVFNGTEKGSYGNYDLSSDPIQLVLPKVIEATNRVLIANGDFDFEILTDGTLLSIQNMTWNGKMGFQEKPSTPIAIDLPDLVYQDAFNASGLGGADGPGQGIMGIQHYERGLMWAETYQCGHMQPQFQPRTAYRHLQWLLRRIETL